MPEIYAGIDLTAGARPSGYAILDQHGALLDIGLCGTNDEIVGLVRRHGATTVAIDCPLGLPRGMDCFDAAHDCAPTGTPPLRVSEHLVRSRGYGLYATTKRSIIATMVLRGMALRTALEADGLRVMEVYPFATKVALFGRPIPKKTTPAGRAWLQDRAAALMPEIASMSRALSHDELDAAVAAYTALLLDRGEAEALGDNDEGAIVVPIVRQRPG